MHEVSNIFTKDKTISSLEVAEMMEIEHKEILKNWKELQNQMGR